MKLKDALALAGHKMTPHKKREPKPVNEKKPKKESKPKNWLLMQIEFRQLLEKD
jgi:hypothetical protein